MARTSRGGRRRREPVDWVVNEFCYGGSVAIGNGALASIPLTVPRWTLENISAPVGTTWGGIAFPEQDQGQLVHRVRGHLEVVPGTWAVGSTFRFIARIVKAPYDFASESMNVDANYSLQSATFANERFNWQEVYSEMFSLGAVGEVKRVDAKMRQRIEPNEALWMVVENASGITQTLLFRSWMRTLMRADGG